ncbi:MAG: hypothetical protein HC769_38035 [Cyanobacteria bacterium CRU_2_1]|nr:hypothetical protein [Cyanobacteria bacterium CRU_2_1]
MTEITIQTEEGRHFTTKDLREGLANPRKTSSAIDHPQLAKDSGNRTR